MSDAAKRVHCKLHSETPATFVCRHLRFGVGCGFHCSSADPGDRWPDAWCDSCEAAFQRHSEWRDSNEPEISLLCTGCYEVARARNSYVPAPLVSGQLTVSDKEFAELAHQSCERSKLRQEAAKQAWPKFVAAKRWYLDEETRTIRFFDDPTREALVADATITGSFSRRSDSWMWVWANEEYADAERAKVAPVRVFGEVRGIEKLHTGHWAAEEIDGWEVTQIAADLLGAAAIYRVPVGHMFVFMLLNDFRTVHPS
jgi:hypothetical protein